jgi:hypothetical protein
MIKFEIKISKQNKSTYNHLQKKLGANQIHNNIRNKLQSGMKSKAHDDLSWKFSFTIFIFSW